ncbi:MAG: fumarylacetoacetate hydrolase family protein [Sneathiellaceae bacterium]
MATMTDGATFDPVADEVLALLGSSRQVEPFTARHGEFGLERAYRVAAQLRQAREDRGERAIGRKIGFTNRTIWAEYGVAAPIWGHVYDGTVLDLDDCTQGVPLAGLPEPRIEPEIAFGLSAPPAADMTDAELLGCIHWVAHGFEIVQSIFPGWKFAAADTVAAGGLHAALLLGPRQPVAGREADWLRDLPRFDIALSCNGKQVDRGHAGNVLGGPLSALAHLAGVLEADPEQPPLVAGEIVTTGTLTRAMPVAGGQTWRTELTGIDLDGIAVEFA